MENKVETVFDKIRPILDSEGFVSWSENDASVLLSFLDSYYKLQQKQGKLGSKKKEEEQEDVDVDNDDMIDEVNRSLTKLRHFLQRRVPYNSLRESQRLHSSSLTTGPLGNGNGEATRQKREVETPVFSVDAFLYLESDIEELVNRGCISREYCRTCGSVDIGLCDYITHSFSQEQLVFLSCFLLPCLSDPSYFVTSDMRLRRREKGDLNAVAPFGCQKVVDVGSRLGVVLLACYFAAQQKRLQTTRHVTGVELDGDMVAVQRDAIKRFAAIPASVELSVVHSNCFEGDGMSALRDADVVILHNVFEYFSATPAQHFQSWRRLREIVTRRGQLLICSPSLQETFSAFTSDVVRSVMTDDALNNEPAAQQQQRGKEEHENGTDRKRPRDEEDDALLERWLQSWVEAIDVTEVQEVFFALQNGEGGAACHDAHSHSEEEDEWMERVRGVYVYLVK